MEDTSPEDGGCFSHVACINAYMRPTNRKSPDQYLNQLGDASFTKSSVLQSDVPRPCTGPQGLVRFNLPGGEGV
jgi:hypothetical protein